MKQWLKYGNLFSGSLLLTLFISLVLSIICSSILLLYYFDRISLDKYLLSSRIQRNKESAVNLILADASFYKEPLQRKISLFKNAKDSVEIITKPWGAYQMASVRVTAPLQDSTTCFLYGNKPNTSDNLCLYLGDHLRPLRLSGAVKLFGDISLPKAGITGCDPGECKITGNTSVSNPNLPEVSDEFINYLTNLGQSSSQNFHLLNSFIYNPFYKDLLWVGGDSLVGLYDNDIAGHVIVSARHKIIVGKNAQLRDIILMAPKVEIEEGFKGNVQIIATDSINIGKEVSLNYPSALILINHHRESFQSYIRIKENCVVSGVVFSLGLEQNKLKTYLEINSGASITGTVYVNGFTQLQGTINGMLYTDYFISKTSISVNENLLKDATINRYDLPVEFVGATFIINQSFGGVIKWL